jgi:hypothetical protein
MHKARRLPIISQSYPYGPNHSTLAGDVIIHEDRQYNVFGYASTVAGATRKIKSMLSAESRYLIEKCGFKLHVFQRNTQLLGGLDGWIWSVGK